MTRIITIASRKGGSGKTTTAQMVSAGLEQLGYKTLVIDMDSQINLSLLHDVPADAPPTIAEVLEGTPAADAIRNTSGGDIIPGHTAMKTTEPDQPANALQRALDPIKNKYDFIIIDNSAQLDSALIKSLLASDQLIITAEPDLLSLQGVALIMRSVKAVQEQHKLDNCGIVVTRYKPRSRTAQTMAAQLEAMAEKTGAKMYKTRIRECTAVSDAQARQTDIFSFRIGSNAAKDYAQLINEILKERKEP